jgi:hypothetical protein
MVPILGHAISVAETVRDNNLTSRRELAVR